MASNSCDIVPKGPPDLCFDSSAFTKETFSVDKFLQDHRTGGNLEAMRDDLGLYLKVLRSAMIDLINKDYADYVNLSSNLIGLDKAISSINIPLGQLKEELLQVQQHIDTAIAEVTSKLEHRKSLREQKRALKSLSRVQTSLKKLRILLTTDQSPGDRRFLERAVAEYCQLQCHSQHCSDLLSDNERQNMREFGSLLIDRINTIFLESLKLKESGKAELCCSLSFYLQINKQEDVERFYRERIVVPALQPIINEETLRSLHGGLLSLYEKIISFIDGDMKILRDVTSTDTSHPGLVKYNFLLNSVWPEIEERLEINLPSIYAAGDPDAFFTRYSQTLNFLSQLEERFKDLESVSRWHNLKSFTSFMDKWNLPVYFQIRLQETVKCVEESMASGGEKSKTSPWRLQVSSTIWASVSRLWADGVFLSPIAHKFCKLTLQTLARFHIWIDQALTQKSSVLKPNEPMQHLKILISLYKDVELMIKRLPEFEELVLGKLPHVSENTALSLNRSLGESGEALSGTLGAVEGAVVSGVAGRCAGLVRQAADIPRLYRRTNREPPSKPCPYISSLLETPLALAAAHPNDPLVSRVLHAVFSDITKQYYSSVAEVLTSVQKTEESLRRLKKARDRAAAVPTGDRRPADDDKIRLQLLIDVQAYSKGIESLGIKVNAIEKLSDLLLLVETTQKT